MKANDNIPADEFELAEDIAWVRALSDLFGSSPRQDGRDSEDVQAEEQVAMEPCWCGCSEWHLPHQHLDAGQVDITTQGEAPTSVSSGVPFFPPPTPPTETRMARSKKERT